MSRREEDCFSLKSYVMTITRAGASPTGKKCHEGLAEALDSPQACPSGSAMGWAVNAMSIDGEERHPDDVINPSPSRMMPSLPTHTPNRTGAPPMHSKELGKCDFEMS